MSPAPPSRSPTRLRSGAQRALTRRLRDVATAPANGSSSPWPLAHRFAPRHDRGAAGRRGGGEAVEPRRLQSVAAAPVRDFFRRAPARVPVTQRPRGVRTPRAAVPGSVGGWMPKGLSPGVEPSGSRGIVAATAAAKHRLPLVRPRTGQPPTSPPSRRRAVTSRKRPGVPGAPPVRKEGVGSWIPAAARTPLRGRRCSASGPLRRRGHRGAAPSQAGRSRVWWVYSALARR